jgi:hypothetical protein
MEMERGIREASVQGVEEVVLEDKHRARESGGVSFSALSTSFLV